MTKITQEMHEYFSKLGKKARKVHPYPKEHYDKMTKKSAEALRAKKALKLSPPDVDATNG